MSEGLRVRSDSRHRASSSPTPATRAAASLTVLQRRARTVADGEEIFPGVRVRLTPGHASYVITSGSQRLIAFGDAMHSPIQVSHPELAAAPDLDPVQASQHRRLVDDLAKPGTLGFGVHFADVVFGRVRPGGDQPGTSGMPTRQPGFMPPT